MKKNKKSQFLILSGMFLFLTLIFIYYQETDNNYIPNSRENYILNNIISETCYIGKNSNGSQINNRYQDFQNNVSQYCQEFNNVCILNITNNTQIPPEGNWSKLNYTHYNYEINYQWNHYSSNINFTC